MKRSKESNVCKIEVIGDKFNLFFFSALYRSRQISPNNSCYFQAHIFFRLFRCLEIILKITNIYIILLLNFTINSRSEFFFHMTSILDVNAWGVDKKNLNTRKELLRSKVFYFHRMSFTNGLLNIINIYKTNNNIYKTIGNK